uniref:Sodium-coupled neutral amino acid transporter 3-like n=1 Tax=Gouania willdenowi TaxID=441366 RepID=A0A8C5EAL3_GOUWI
SHLLFVHTSNNYITRPLCEAFLLSYSQFEGKTSFGMSVFNLSNAIMGSGILGLSYAMSNTGIVLFLILLTCIACLSCYSVHLLLRSAGVVGIRAYEQLGLRAFGHPGKIIAAIAITLHNIGAMSSYLFIVKYELPLVIQTFLGLTSSSEDWFMNGNYLIILVTVSIILPLALMRHLGYLGYTSGFSLSCMVFFLSAVSQNLELYHIFCCEVTLLLELQTAYTIPILAFAFVCHPEVLPIYTELSKRMQNIGNVSILGMFIMYFFTATFGYLTFYENTEAELLHTYSKVDPLDTLILCVRLAVLVAVTLTVPVVLFPIRRALLQLLFPGKPFNWLRHIAIAVSLLICVNLLVIFVPNIRDIFGFTGATTAPTLIFILPGLFYIRIIPTEREPLNSRPKIQALCFSALGFIFMTMSLTFIILDWTTGEKRSLGGH